MLVTVASGERNFFKLNLTETYLQSTILKSRLNNLVMLSIENGNVIYHTTRKINVPMSKFLLLLSWGPAISSSSPGCEGVWQLPSHIPVPLIMKYESREK